MAGKVFVNYRRGNDAAPELRLGAAQALNVAQYLENRFGKARVFIDIDRLRAGQKFPAVLESKLGECKVMLAIIGPGWLEARDAETGARRLDNPEDWVRLEIERALARDIPVIPVLVGGAALPSKRDLPASLHALVDHQTATVSPTGFRHEMAGLARDVEALMGPRRWGALSAAAIAMLAVAYGLAVQLGAPLPWPGRAGDPTEGARAKSFAEPRRTEEVEAQAPAKAADEQKRLAALKVEEDRVRAAAEARRLAALKAEEDRKAEEARKKAEADAVRPGRVFRDCNDGCPEMVVVPAGSFTMGSNDGGNDEKPTRTVTIRQPFAVGKFEVTFAEWEACVAGGGCASNKSPKHEGWGKDRRPVINVSWNDAKEYVAWLSRKTGQTYRLLTEAEWEYAARGGKGDLKYWWGNEASHEYANYGKDQCCGGLAQGRDVWINTAPVGQFPANPFGLHDMHGNVWEWVEDCYASSYNNAPTDGSKVAETSGCSRVVRGGSWYNFPYFLRSANRSRLASELRYDNFGFRVARPFVPPRTL